MNFRTTFIIILVLVGIAGAYFLFFQEPADDASVNDKPRIHQVYGLAQENIQQARLSFADEVYQPLTLEKRAQGTWLLTEPLQADADSAKVDEMLNDLLNKRVKQTLEVDELGQYGLDTPSITLALWTDPGASPKTFLIGKKAINYSVYTKEKSEAHIFLIESSALDDLTKSPTDLRDRSVIRFNSETVSKIQFQNQEEIQCEKSGNIWTMTHPISVKADTQEIETFLLQLSSLQVSTFEADGADVASQLEKYGLDAPRIQMTLTDGNGTHALDIGSAVPTQQGQATADTGRVYVKSVHQGGVYTVTDNIYTLLNKSVFDLRDKRILDFQRTATTRFEIQRGTESSQYGKPASYAQIVCTKGLDDTWELQEYNTRNESDLSPDQIPLKIKADAKAVDDLLFGVDSLEAVAFVTNSAKSLAPYGLESPAIQVAFTQRGEEKPAVLHIGNYGQDDTVYVKASDSAQVTRVKRDLIDKIAMGIAWLRDKQVLNFGIDDAIRFTLQHGDVSLTCQRQRLGTNWRLIAPVKEDANNAEVNAIIYEIDDLTVEAFVGTASAPSVATTGLNSPQMQVTVELRNQKVYTLQVGTADTSGRFYARLRHEPNLIFLLNAELIPKLKTTLALLRTPE